jgi:hyperosmotically inducible protein
MLRFLLVLVIVGAIAAWLLGYLPVGRNAGDTTVGTQIDRTIDTEAARQRGAELGERVAAGANRVVESVDDAALTGKIKSKMALDDTVRALDIDVDTTDGVVTLTGVVRTDTERQRALQLARETNGVRSVQDRLSLRQ